jgi:hypothetical protein
VALTGLAGYGLWVAFHSPALKTRRVDVVGAQRLGAERVRRLAAIPLGRNIFCTNLYRARLAVESNPQVASAMVSRDLPNTVRIAVQERQPVFVVVYDGSFFETDEAGIPFYQVPKPTPKLPILALRNVGPVRLGNRLSPEVMQPALACLRLTRLSARDRSFLWKINVDDPHELCLNMKVPSRLSPAGKTLRIRLGRPEDLALKLADARRVLAGRPQIVDDAQYLDVSCAGRPVYMAQALTNTASLAAQGAAPAPPPAADGSRGKVHTRLRGPRP